MNVAREEIDAQDMQGRMCSHGGRTHDLNDLRQSPQPSIQLGKGSIQEAVNIGSMAPCKVTIIRRTLEGRPHRVTP